MGKRMSKEQYRALQERKQQARAEEAQGKSLPCTYVNNFEAEDYGLLDFMWPLFLKSVWNVPRR